MSQEDREKHFQWCWESVLKDFGKDLSKLTLLNEDKPELRVKQQVRVLGARKTMMHRFGMGAGCHWWADLLCGWHMHRHGCNWTDLCAVPGYWSCWTRCHYRVVWCPTVHGHVRSAWYFGIESFLIPDVHALGVHVFHPPKLKLWCFMFRCLVVVRSFSWI